jgi:hypothetical protein
MRSFSTASYSDDALFSGIVMQAKVLPWASTAWFTAMMFAVAPALAEMSAEELAKLAQNPVGNLISLPFQNNTNLNFGPEKGTQNIFKHPASDPDLGERRLEPHHPHHRAGDLDAVALSGR